jgi:predicted DNA repair protein MutK
MASGFFAILDDITALMDDVAVATKVATRKTAGILGDDLAVNAEKATGFLSSRELPVLWAITKGSFINKLIIVPVALLLNAFFPAVIKIILILGGLYLAYEGVEKIIEFLFHRSKSGHEVIEEVKQDDSAAEKIKIKSAITTDFILSIEIVIIALGSVAAAPLTTQVATVIAVALLATVGVYGLVALIVRMDDAGYRLIKHSNNKGFLTMVGSLLVKALPIIIRVFAVVGTIALLLVAGGIFVHNIDYFHHILPQLYGTLKELAFGIVGGLLVVALVTVVKKTISLFK